MNCKKSTQRKNFFLFTFNIYIFIQICITGAKINKEYRICHACSHDKFICEKSKNHFGIEKNLLNARTRFVFVPYSYFSSIFCCLSSVDDVLTVVLIHAFFEICFIFIECAFIFKRPILSHVSHIKEKSN